MSEYLQNPTVDLSTREKILGNFPCFANLNAALRTELARFLNEVRYLPNENIVMEDAIVDSIYLIVSGEAEVTREMPQRKKSLQVPVAVLGTGEAIGLNDTGFYAATGKRTATVTAMTEMLLLRLDLKNLYDFLMEHNLESSMYAASKQMLRMQFIKQSLPFSRLSHERLQWLADQVEEIQVPEGTIIFRQGDQGDKCYLIRSGQIEISSSTDEGEEHQLAILKAPTLFGEATLITKEPRNATATAIEDCKLFVLQQEHLTELIESEDNVANMFMTLTVDRSRPAPNPHVTMHQRTTADGQLLTILKNPDNGAYFKLSAEGAFIWKQLNGEHTLQEITLDLAEKFNVFAPNIVAALISKLSKEGFIANLELPEQQLTSQPLWVRLYVRAEKIFLFRFAFGDADAWITRTYNKYICYLFTRTSQVILALLAIIGFFAFVVSTNDVLHFFSKEKASFFLLFTLIPLSMLEVILHELAHAYAVKAFGREVHYVGVGWNYLVPIAFVDTSDMWLSPRKPRMLVNLAGIYVDTIVAGIAAILIFCIPNAYIQGMLWLFALYIYIGAFRMLSPLQEMDGYYVLMDWVDKNRLRQAAVLWLVKDFPKALRQPRLFRGHWPEISYWLMCIIFLILISVLTLIVQHFVFDILGIQATNPYLTLIVPFLVVIFSSIGIIADIRRRAED